MILSCVAKRGLGGGDTMADPKKPLQNDDQEQTDIDQPVSGQKGGTAGNVTEDTGIDTDIDNDIDDTNDLDDNAYPLGEDVDDKTEMLSEIDE